MAQLKDTHIDGVLSVGACEDVEAELSKLNSKIHVVSITSSESWHKIIKYSDGTVILYGAKQFSGIACTTPSAGKYVTSNLYFSVVPSGITINNLVTSFGQGSIEGRI